ncbi:hypothetical protein N9191_00455 [bacterium]|nr:hypothetical protein [bacterium]
MKGDKSFVDHIRIRCKSGDGGNGIVSFRREKFVPRGGPDGGDGGDGGQVVIKVDENTDNLRAFHYDPKLIAENGAQGQTYKRHGKNGKTAIGRVPPGTVIYKSPAVTVTDAVAMERSEDGIDLEPVIDLTEHGQEVTLCVGGKGGRGNFHFRTATNQVPQEREMGTDGSEGIYYLELRPNRNRPRRRKEDPHPQSNRRSKKQTLHQPRHLLLHRRPPRSGHHFRKQHWNPRNRRHPTP